MNTYGKARATKERPIGEREKTGKWMSSLRKTWSGQEVRRNTVRRVGGIAGAGKGN